MNIPHSKFCILPWVSLEASPVGTVRPCCLAKDEILDDDGHKFTLSNSDFLTIQNSNYMKQLRTQFVNGEQPDTCQRCWAEESAGRTSKRMHTLDRLKNTVSHRDWNTDAKPLMFLDLKLGNICNLKCRICGSWSSSQFATEEIKYTDPKQRKKTFAYQMLQAGAWPRNSKHFWQQIDQHLDHIQYIEFTGGEPFLIEQHFELLQGMIDRGIAAQVEIHYNTNGTVYPPHAQELWKHFKLVEIAFSIDDIGERFEYQRSNANWAEVCENIDQFRQLKKINGNIALQICTTVNVFNVLYLDQVAAWIDKNIDSFDFVYWNMLHDAWYFSIASLPESAKQSISKYLDSVSTSWKLEFERIRDFMNQGKSSNGQEMLKQIAVLDQRRDQNLWAVAPELAEIIGYEQSSL